MKTKRNITAALGLAVTALVLFGSGLSLRACSACTNRNQPAIKLPETVEGLLEALHDHDEALYDAIKNKKPYRVPGILMVMRRMAEELPNRASADNKKQVGDTLDSFRRITGDLIRSALSENWAASARNFRYLHEGLAKFDARFNYQTK